MADKLTCLICSRQRNRSNCHIIKLTVDERHSLRSRGQDVLPEYPYCNPCWRIMQNPATASALIKGLTLTHLRGTNTLEAESLANDFQEQLDALRKKFDV